MNSSGTQFADAKDCLKHSADWGHCIQLVVPRLTKRDPPKIGGERC
ncbi:hypothetical protein CA54_56920 [Symmachiella macrocystis]|uniref:Uncharacterized protein n=1 Tax=Symmachiella macrocystis TaxID=2527985 RepID=A0A5C6B690_9PLAN|nr:hypothetical protein CA54_56920 [Symmachiella macrocystis]